MPFRPSRSWREVTHLYAIPRQKELSSRVSGRSGRDRSSRSASRMAHAPLMFFSAAAALILFGAAAAPSPAPRLDPTAELSSKQATDGSVVLITVKVPPEAGET